MSPAPPHPVRAALRQATQQVHERLHHVPAFAALAAGRLELPGYRAVLARLLGFHAPMEQAIATALASGAFGVYGWQRAALLLDDLAAVGATPQEIAAVPRLAPIGPLSPAAAMGCLYVLEGSTLGGRQLARQLDPLLPDAAGRRFLSAGAQPGHVRWTSFCTALERCGADPLDAAAMVDGALQTFTRFEAWFADAA